MTEDATGGRRGSAATLAPGTHTRETARRVNPTERLDGELRLPGDKSIGHRALLFDALGEGEAEVVTYRPGADVRSSAAALGMLGAVTATTTDADGTVHYTVRGGGTMRAARLPGAGDETLDCGNSGTTMRLFAGALAGRPVSAELAGDGSLSGRPMERVATPLRQMGATVATTDGHAPLRITGRTPLSAIEVALPVASAQVLGAVALAGLAADGETRITAPGPTRDHTERLLRWLGAPIARAGLLTTVRGPAGFRARGLEVPGDISSAATWLIAGALHPQGRVRLRHVALNPTRLAIVDVLREMGAAIEVIPDRDGGAGPEPTGDLEVRGGTPLRSITLAGPRVAELIDELPVLAVAMAAADGTSELRDAAELRVKESDRIALVVRGLRAIGASADELPDGWRVSRGAPSEGAITTAGDHRIAMAFAVAATTGVAAAVDLDDAACVDVSYAGFWDDLAALTGAA